MTQHIPSILDNAETLVPGALAATLGDEAITFGDAGKLTRRYAQVLSDLGLCQGDRLVLQADFTLDQIALYFAVQKLGAVFAPINPAFGPEEATRDVPYLRPRIVVQDLGHAASCPIRTDATCVTLGFDGANPLGPRVASADDTFDPGVTIAPDDPHGIFLTSGSTGQPKGVMLSHRASWMRSHLGASRSVGAGGRGELLTFPMFHWSGWNYLMENWAHRRPIHFLTGTTGDDMARAIARHDPAYFYAIPAVWERLLASTVPFDGSRLRSVASGTSKFDPVLMERIAERFPRANRGVYYGATEFGGACCLIEEEIARHPGGVGMPYAGVDVRIVDGELQLRGPTVMSGYFELPEKTAEVMDDGWYRTGDLADIGADGFLTITGRAREVIRSGGETVAPAEVELGLQGFPGLRGVAIIGLNDPTWGEIVCAVAELEPGTACPEVEMLRAWLAGRVAPYKHPRRVFALANLPRTPATGQIMRTRIKQLIEADMR